MPFLIACCIGAVPALALLPPETAEAKAARIKQNLEDWNNEPWRHCPQAVPRAPSVTRIEHVSSDDGGFGVGSFVVGAAVGAAVSDLLENN